MQELFPVTRGQLVYPSYLAGSGDPAMAAPRFLSIKDFVNNKKARTPVTHFLMIPNWAATAAAVLAVGTLVQSPIPKMF